MKTPHDILLKQHGLSLTSVRLALLDVLEASPHADANLLFDQVQQRLATASKQAIYNNLNALVQRGLIREIKPKGRPSLYETRVGDNHHHLICRACYRIEDAACQDARPCLHPLDDHGFCVDEAEVIYWGLCPACQEDERS